MWKLFQMTIVTLVLFSNVHYQWTPNGYLAALIGVGAAYAFTMLLWKGWDFLLWANPNLRRRSDGF